LSVLKTSIVTSPDLTTAWQASRDVGPCASDLLEAVIEHAIETSAEEYRSSRIAFSAAC